MAFDLTSALLKIGRAKELLDGLDAEVRAWNETVPYTGTIQINAEKTRASLVIKVNNEAPIIRWSLIIADIFHNLRCSLDHLVWAIGVHESPTVTPLNSRIQFPIWDTRPGPDVMKNIKSLSPAVRAAIESVQPYSLPYPSLPLHPLSILRDIDNTNKHRLLRTVIASVGKCEVVLNPRDDIQDSPRTFMYTGDIKDGTEAIVTTFDFPHPNMEYKVRSLETIIALKHPIASSLGRDRDEYAALLDIIIRVVQETIDAIALKV